MKKSKEKNVTLTISMSQEMLDDITEIANHSGLTRSSFACSLLYQGLIEYKGKLKAIDSLPEAIQNALAAYAKKLG